MNANLEPSPAPPTGLDVLTTLEQRANQVIEQLRQRAFAPGGLKRHDRRYSIGEAEAMVGRSSQTIRDAEKDGRLPQPAKDSRNRRVGYTLPEINAMRRVFNTLPRRGPDDEAARVAFSNFKGGVGKSTLCVHAAQYMAQSGWRVLVVDADPQGTTTSLFGLNPDTDLEESDTLYPFLRGEIDSIRPLIRRSYFDQIDLLPANLGLYNCEYSLAGEAARGGGTAVFSRLRSGLDSAQDDYDMIFIDPPPALGMISLSVLQAANALVVPIRPATIDFGSTAHFFTMLRSVLEDMRRQGLAAAYKFVTVAINDMDEGKSTHRDIRDMMQNVFANLVFSTVMKDSAEIDNAGGRLMTVYDLNEPVTNRETHLRCLKYLDQLNRELELRIRSTWPSHIKQLRQEGVL